MAYAVKSAKKRIVEEQGMVISITQKAKMDEWRTSDGNLISAKPERYGVLVATSCKFDPVMGFEDPTVCEFEIEDLKEGSKYRYGDKVKAQYEYTQNGMKPINVVRIAKEA